MKKAIIDLETTGFRNSDKITEIAIIKFDGNEIISEFQSLVNPGIPIPQNVIDKTGITNEMVAEAPMFADLINDMIPHLEHCHALIAHNSSFDKRMFVNAFQESHVSFSAHWECTMSMAKQKHPNMASYSLETLCRFFDVKNTNAHRAMADAKATLEIYQKLIV